MGLLPPSRLVSRALRSLEVALLDAWPARWQAPLAQALARLALSTGPLRRRVRRQVLHLLGSATPAASVAVAGVACALAGRWAARWRGGQEARGLAAHPRLVALRHERPAPLLVLPHLGRRALLAAALAGAGRRLDAERPPPRPWRALWLPWLGRWTALDPAPLRSALARGAALRVVLLPEGGAEPWVSPDLGAPAAPGAALEGRVRTSATALLDVLAALVRAAPEQVDWSLERCGWRPERALAGHALSSRWAPTSAPRPRRRRRPRPGG